MVGFLYVRSSILNTLMQPLKINPHTWSPKRIPNWVYWSISKNWLPSWVSNFTKCDKCLGLGPPLHLTPPRSFQASTSISFPLAPKPLIRLRRMVSTYHPLHFLTYSLLYKKLSHLKFIRTNREGNVAIYIEQIEPLKKLWIQFGVHTNFFTS